MELILALLIFIPMLYVMYIFTGYMIQNIKEINEGKTKSLAKAPPKQIAIVERIGCLGYYMDKEIPSHVKLETGEMFEYERIVKMTSDGFCISENPEIMHIRVDEHLLYRLVS